MSLRPELRNCSCWKSHGLGGRRKAGEQGREQDWEVTFGAPPHVLDPGLPALGTSCHLFPTTAFWGGRVPILWLKKWRVREANEPLPVSQLEEASMSFVPGLSDSIFRAALSFVLFVCLCRTTQQHKILVSAGQHCFTHTSNRSSK